MQTIIFRNGRAHVFNFKLTFSKYTQYGNSWLCWDVADEAGPSLSSTFVHVEQLTKEQN
jgi:hypothetical protein